MKKLFCILSGDDYSIIETCDKGIQRRFAAIGAFVFVIFLLCFLSSFFTFIQLFQSYLVGVPAGLFFAFMITNIYLLLLYTLSKHELPHHENILGKLLSTIVRIIFVCFIAIVVSKPIEVFIFSGYLAADIETFKQKELRQFELSTNKFFDEELLELRTALYEEVQLSSNSTAARIAHYRELIEAREKKRNELNAKMRNLVERSNYYVRSIVILNNRYYACWLITLVVIAIFIGPSYLKNYIPSSGRFYGQKREIERKLVIAEYENFKSRYSDIFKAKYKANINFCEPFEDPPFNTSRKRDLRKFLDEEKLIAEIYNV